VSKNEQLVKASRDDGRPDLPGISEVDFVYKRREKSKRLAVREAFNDGKRANFLKTLAAKAGDRLKAIGLSQKAITTMSAGRVPTGYNVHHIHPIDDSGTNSPSNLVLIRISPDHQAIHNALNPQILGLNAGQSRHVTLLEPESGFYDSVKGKVSLAEQDADREKAATPRSTTTYRARRRSFDASR
jgi:hypothetical protein